MPYQIIRNDIVKMHVDAIVNPTDEFYSGSGGTDECVHLAAGREMDRACAALPQIAEGMVAVTEGFDLPCKYVIHTIGPVWEGGTFHEKETLVSCYRNSLSAAEERGCESIAFPLIASGTFGYPKDQVLRVALETITEYLMGHDMTVYIVVYDPESYSISKKLQADIDSFIDENYVDAYGDESRRPNRRNVFHADTILEPFYTSDDAVFSGAGEVEAFLQETVPAPMHAIQKPKPAEARPKPVVTKPAVQPGDSLEDRLRNLDEPFSVCLLRLIDEKGLTDVQCYKKANIDKKLFSKMRNPAYRPSKPTVLACAFALELTLEEAQAFLMKAGYALSNSSMFDVVIRFFFENGQYDLMEINETLYKYDLPCLGNVIA